ncbi:MAG: flagellar basal body rod protein FlgB [Treponema sp.]|nr:flagellar basal body rod protein FlgB [Treponema sp.]MBD5411690.1 flagellar basal body rod protein FlgB [Treponema sp.]MBD5413289.1 flagellar basal body rod protein FlgB [Treponema sp.]
MKQLLQSTFCDGCFFSKHLKKKSENKMTTDFFLRGFLMNDFTRSIDLLHRAMDAASLRYQVSADNLSKSEVPNFKRSTVNFESELKRAFDSEEKARNAFQLTRTDERHISLYEPYDYRDVEPRRVLDYTTTAKANGNNVDAETEANNILQIQMQYRLLAQLTNFEFSQINTVLKK